MSVCSVRVRVREPEKGGRDGGESRVVRIVPSRSGACTGSPAAEWWARV